MARSSPDVGEPVPPRAIFLRWSGYQAGCGVSRALSSSAATASRSRWKVPICPAVSRPCSRVRAVRTASRNVRARVRPTSSGAVASSAVSRSSSADTWLDPTAQPPAAWSSDAASRSSGTRTRANHANSPSAAARSARHARRRRTRSRSGTATATATKTAASSHHNHPVGSLVSAADPGAGSDGVVNDGDGDVNDADSDGVDSGVGAASAGSAEARGGGSVVVTVWAGCSGRVTDRVGLGGSAVWVGDSGRVGDRVRSGTVAVRLGSSPADRDDVADGRLGAPPSPHAMSSNATAVRTAARFISRSKPTPANPALLTSGAFESVAD